MSLKDAIQSSGRRARLGVVLPLAYTVRLYGGTDKWVHGYTPFYERHLGPVRFRRNRILEIGVGGYERLAPGGSLRVWRDWFPRSRIVGLDINEKVIDLGSRVSFAQGDQSAPSDLDRAIEALGGPPNIVIDDGSHYAGHAVASFEHMFPLMPSGSAYAVEDLSTSYWERWGGSLEPTSETAVGMAKHLVHDVQARDSTFVRHPGWGAVPAFDRSDVAELHVYPGIFIVIKA
jgi:hypothetical protein